MFVKMICNGISAKLEAQLKYTHTYISCVYIYIYIYMYIRTYTSQKYLELQASTNGQPYSKYLLMY